MPAQMLTRTAEFSVLDEGLPAVLETSGERVLIVAVDGTRALAEWPGDPLAEPFFVRKGRTVGTVTYIGA